MAKKTKPPIEKVQPNQHAIDPKKGVTIQEEIFARKFVEYMGTGLTKTQAVQKAMAVAYKDTIHVKKGYLYQVIGRSRVQRYISKLMDKAGLGHEAIIRDLRKVITRGLNADKASLSDAVKGLDMAVRMQGMYPAQKIESKSVKATVDLMNRTKKDMQKEYDELEAEEAEFDEIIEEGEIVED